MCQFKLRIYRALNNLTVVLSAQPNLNQGHLVTSFVGNASYCATVCILCILG